MKTIRDRIKQLWSSTCTAARAARRNRWALGKSFAHGAAYKAGVIAVLVLYAWWTARH